MIGFLYFDCVGINYGRCRGYPRVRLRHRGRRGTASQSVDATRHGNRNASSRQVVSSLRRTNLSPNPVPTKGEPTRRSSNHHWSATNFPKGHTKRPIVPRVRAEPAVHRSEQEHPQNLLCPMTLIIMTLIVGLRICPCTKGTPRVRSFRRSCDQLV